MYDIIIIGGGPSGIMCAIHAQKRYKRIAIIDSNALLLQKFRITGNGRSNILNYCDLNEFLNHVHNSKFLMSALHTISPKDVYALLQSFHIPLKIENHNRVYPQSDDANDAANQLIAQLKNVDIIHDTVTKIENHFTVYTATSHYRCKKLVIATGGKSYPSTGSTGDGYQFARSFNHTITPLYPVETPIISNASFIQQKTLQGVTLKNVKLSINKKYAYIHDMIFTHFGISGPLSLGMSENVYHHLQKHSHCILTLDCFPHFNYVELTTKIQDLIHSNPQSMLKNSLKSLLPTKLLTFLLNEIKLDPTTIANQLSVKQLQSLVDSLKNFNFPVHDVKPIKNAFVTGGGVHLKEIKPSNFESKLVDNLFFIGEILDLHGKIGGYNLTTCFITGIICGSMI